MQNTQQHLLVEVSDVALHRFRVFLAHDRGGWGPENSGSDYMQNELQHDSQKGCYSIDPLPILKPAEEFKLVIPVDSESQAKEIYAERSKAGVLVSERFDFDANHQTFWLLVPGYPVVRPMAWNQNNVFFHPGMVKQ